MPNATLYKRGLKSSWKVLVVFMAILTLYTTVMISMYNPDLRDVMDQLSASMPQLMEMFGMHAASGQLVGFLSSYLYGMILLVFPMIFTIMTANKLVAAYTDRGSLVYLLAAPISRARVAITQLCVLWTFIFVLFGYVTGLGLVTAHFMFPGELDVGKYLLLNLGDICLQLFIAGLAFLSSCAFSETRYSLGVGAGIPVVMYLMQMIANYGDKFASLKYATFFTLFNPSGLIAGQASSYVGIAVLAAGGLALFGVAVWVFRRRDLHI